MFREAHQIEPVLPVPAEGWRLASGPSVTWLGGFLVIMLHRINGIAEVPSEHTEGRVQQL